MKLKAFAKLNLSLHILDKRLDGYHNLESLMQSVSLADIITLTPNPDGITVTCSNPAVPLGPKNLVYKAADLFRQQTKDQRLKTSGINIHIEKNIPMAAGLAGGSADAAVVLYGLNKLQTEDHRLQTEDLLTLGAQIGSDIPFCLTGGTCLVEGRGEILTEQAPWQQPIFVLVTPNLHVSTKWAYEEFDREHFAAGEEIRNDLEPVVATRYPEIIDLKERLLQLGCYETQMSGSGPSVFGAVHKREKAQEIVDQIKLDYPQSFVVETVQRGVEIIEP
jgi:4-diphosphocytidyl-2-C-methyl-D-erythritol kinase